MQLIRDDKDGSLFRHIRFKKPGSMSMHFDLITWPGHLCYTGDMGTYVFRRLDDMLEFFRSGRKEGPLHIDLGYWSEKLIAVDGGRNKGSATEFSMDRFKRVINEYRIGWIRDAKTYGRLTKEERRQLWEAVDEAVLYNFDEGEHAVYARANDFSWSKGHRLPGNDPTYSFDDLWDHRFTDYTYHFTWCCYALAWGIRQYDKQ
jgi:hypothetical protein